MERRRRKAGKEVVVADNSLPRTATYECLRWHCHGTGAESIWIKAPAPRQQLFNLFFCSSFAGRYVAELFEINGIGVHLSVYPSAASREYDAVQWIPSQQITLYLIVLVQITWH